MKYGEFYDSISDSLTPPAPTQEDFTGSHCDKDVKIRMKIKESEITISGKFSKKKKCEDEEDCLKLWYRGEGILGEECVNMGKRNKKR